MITRAISHLKKDTGFKKIIETYPKPTFKNRNAGQYDVFIALMRSIIYQQLSGKAAGTIFTRFGSLFKDNIPTPHKVRKLRDEDFKKVGVSGQKMKYIKDLAEKFLDGTIVPATFSRMSDEEIREHLTVVKGIGKWTADMFLMFTLKRPDVLPVGDLGIQKGFKKFFNLRTLPTGEKMEKLSKQWRPYRTVACMYLWRTLDGDTDTNDW